VEPVRCFIAVELPEEIKKGLKNLQAQLKSGGQFPAKWVDPYSTHLTLKFLGNVAEDRLGEITKAMEEASRGLFPFNLEVKGLGVFPNPRRVQVAWVGVSGEVEKLANLQRRLETKLVPLGFAPENRRFTPHLTLARLHDRASADERQRFGQLIADSEFETGYSWPVTTVNLMRSQLTREGAVYSRISSVELK